MEFILDWKVILNLQYLYFFVKCELTFNTILAALRLLAFLLLAGVDTGVAVYYRYVAGVDTLVSYVAHLAGALVGLLLGIVVLRNLREHKWERVLWWFCLILFLILFLAAIIQNAVLIGLN